jgi:pimeloyl-ACP methyl ester carboxylesterase
LYASKFSSRVSAAIVLAPHILVEDMGLAGIRKAKDAYEKADLRFNQARHHDDPDFAFYGWNDVWLSSAFRSWDIADEIKSIACPVLAIQGVDDVYGSFEAQIEGIAKAVKGTETLKLENCGHAPHAEKESEVSDAVESFLKRRELVDGASSL